MQKLTRIALPVVVIAAVALVGLSPEASSAATSQARTRVTCSSISGIFQPGQKLTLSGCTGATGGSGTTAAPFFTPSTIQWKSGATTTVTFNPWVQLHATSTCPNQTALRDGRVKSTTLKGITLHFWADFCLRGNRVSLVPGTLMDF